MKIIKRAVIPGTLALFLFLAPVLRANPAEEKPRAEAEEFLSQVRYIITKEEKKAFQKLRGTDVQKFIDEFWKRRDPSPDSEENEFKDEYFRRIASADELFVGEGRPGWLTERGRVFVLYGPPSQRQTAPLSGGIQGRCQEVWYYGDFPVVFSDSTCSGSYALATLDLGPIQRLRITNMTAQAGQAAQESPVADFDIRLKQNLLQESRLEAVVIIEVPYRKIWLEADGDKLRTTIDLRIELKDSRDVLHWEYQKSYSLVLTPDEIAKLRDQTYNLFVPLIVDKDVASLRLGKNKLTVVLKNTTGKEEVRKTAEFNLKERSNE